MATKNNRAGNQQPYIPAGHGDESGEYAGDNYGGSGSVGNKHITLGGQTSKTPNSDVKQDTQSKPKTEQVPQIKNNQPTNAEQKRLQEVGVEKYVGDIETSEYTKNFAENFTYHSLRGYDMTIDANVKISRGSLDKSTQKVFNTALKDMFEKYPNMQKFTNIKVDNRAASNKGGYISRTYYNGEVSYELYINASWINKPSSQEKYQKEIAYYKSEIERIKQSDFYTNKDYIIDNYNKTIQGLEKRLGENAEVYNVIERVNGKEERLKNLMAHELMHRIYHENMTRELSEKTSKIYKQALENGDARKISVYATTSQGEFISEANACLESGIEIPDYIKDIVNEIKGV